MESILQSMKKLVGGVDEYDSFFDPDIILYVNTVFSVLTQLGVGPEDGFSISGTNEQWADFLPDDQKTLQMVKTYMGLKVKLYFDPPLNSSVLQAMERQATELEWRLNVNVDPGEQENG